MLLVVSTAGAAPPPPREVTDEDVDFAIGRLMRSLWDTQRETGEWRDQGYSGSWSGTTPLALFALLEAGADPQDERIKKGLDFLAAETTRADHERSSKELYLRATYVMALSQVIAASKQSPYRDALIRQVQWFTKAAAAHGAWGYRGPERTGDNSCSQFALLALWEADRAGLKLDPSLIRAVEATWLKRQQNDGGWPYEALPGVKSDSTLSMTTAGLASLYICQDVLTTTSGPYRHQKAMDAGWEFLARHLKENYISNGYLAFCVQRCGMASGRKFIGDMDWYAAGAGKLAEPSTRAGSYGGVVRTAFDLIFLARGRIPITFNKLQHGQDDGWDYHTRDLSHFTEYMRRSFERRMRWQIVRVTDNVQLLLDSPILLIPGRQPLDFTAEQWAKLREYTLRGGTLLFMPVGDSKPFLESARKELADLYAEQRELAGGHYALEQLPSDHPIYSVHQRVPNGENVAPMWGVSDGTRLLAVVCERDLARAWQQGMPTGRSVSHMLGVNFFLYTTGANELSTRLRPVFVSGQAGPEKIKHRVKVAWLKHGGNWCTQPYGLEYLSKKLAAENRVAMDVTEGVPAEIEKLKGNHLAWITGSADFSFTDEELSALRNYIDEGGTIFVNAVGGSREFDSSARQMLDKLLPAGEAVTGYVGEDSPLMTGKIGDFRGPPVGRPARTVALRKLGQAAPPLLLYMRHGRIAVIYARHGIHDTLDGHTSQDAASYMPSSARDMAANIVLYGLLEKPKGPPATAPATSPATATAPTGE